MNMNTKTIKDIARHILRAKPYLENNLKHERGLGCQGPSMDHVQEALNLLGASTEEEIVAVPAAQTDPSKAKLVEFITKWLGHAESVSKTSHLCMDHDTFATEARAVLGT